jgi:hypothetical protein
MMPSTWHVFQGSVYTIDHHAFHFGFILGLPGQVWSCGEREAKTMAIRFRIPMPLLLTFYYYWIVESTKDKWNGFEVALFGFKEDKSECREQGE